MHLLHFTSFPQKRAVPLIAYTYLVRTQDQIGKGGKGEGAGGGGLLIEMYEKTDAVRVKGGFILIVVV